MASNTATATFSHGGGGGRGGGRGRGGHNNNNYNNNNNRQPGDPDQMVVAAESQPQQRGHRRQNHKPAVAPPPNLADELTQQMKAMLDRRYNPAQKLLDLSAYEQDPEFANSGVFSKPSTRAKFFPALMRVCQIIPKEMVTGVILSNNKLKDLTAVSSLPDTFPDLKNLDLSNNELINLDPLWEWRRKFLSLEHLIISGNPLEKHMKAGWEDKIKRWYQQLRILNTTEVRPANANPTAPAPVPAPAAPAAMQPAVPAPTPQPLQQPQSGLVIPPGFGIEAPGKTPEQMQKEQMAIEVSKATNMTLQYSGMCLEQSSWDLKEAEKVYLAAKPTLPPEAFFSP